ncbi:unnamed protein product [Trifolium pratense]|uniref:Uncharacterized protein n=1 Tax=Trifolium pratense TaxID=57577 RepID=A0ACB0JW95_TRIPR|nr:unnamed protein product [Trifolium pratense]
MLNLQRPLLLYNLLCQDIVYSTLHLLLHGQILPVCSWNLVISTEPYNKTRFLHRYLTSVIGKSILMSSTFKIIRELERLLLMI